MGSRQIGFLPTPFSANFDPQPGSFRPQMRPAGELPARDRCFRFQVGLQRTQADVDLGRVYFHEQLLAQIQVVIFAARRRDSSMQARRFDKARLARRAVFSPAGRRACVRGEPAVITAMVWSGELPVPHAAAASPAASP